MDLKLKSNIFDPCPLWLTKQHLSTVLPNLLSIVNSSLQTGTVPNVLKHGIIRPLLKKTLDTNNLINYRPITNLPFLPKILEKVVAKQLTAHMTKHSLHDDFQSAYKPGFSTETVLLKVKDYIQSYFDNCKGVLLAMIDMSAAFDTLSHDILLGRLCSEVGISGSVLMWFKSHLANRCQSVLVGDTLSDSKNYCIIMYPKVHPLLYFWAPYLTLYICCL